MKNYEPPSRAEIAALLEKSGLSRNDFALSLFVSPSTLDLWLASDDAKTRGDMPQNAWELAKIIYGHADAMPIFKKQCK